jgi:hypothetical protein
MADVSMVQVLPLDEWVLNTEAHPLPIQGSKRSMELQHLVLTPPQASISKAAIMLHTCYGMSMSTMRHSLRSSMRLRYRL